MLAEHDLPVVTENLENSTTRNAHEDSEMNISNAYDSTDNKSSADVGDLYVAEINDKVTTAPEENAEGRSLGNNNSQEHSIHLNH